MRTRFLVALSVAMLTACQGVVASGHVTTSTREIPAFRKVQVQSGFTLEATTGARSLTIRADDNVQELIVTSVVGDVLVVGLEPTTVLSPGATLRATLSNDLYEGLDASGAAHVTLPATPVTRFPLNVSGSSVVEVSGLSSTDLSVDASGGSLVTLSGAASSARLSVSGASKVTTTQVPLQTLVLDVSGASTVTASVSSSVSGAVSGASTVTLQGAPTTNEVQLSGGSHLNLGAP